MDTEKSTDIDIQSRISSILNWVEDTAKSVGTFTVEQTPIYITELLAWNFIVSMLYFIISSLSLGVGIYLLRKSILGEFWASEWRGYSSYPKHPKMIANFVVSLVCLLPGLIGSMSNLDWIQIWVAPRVWLVEHISNLLK